MPLEELAQGVYAFLQLPGGIGRANAGVIVDEDGVSREGADHFERARENLRVGLRAFEAMRKDEAVILREQRRELPWDR